VSATILDREMYTEAAAARLLRVAPSTLTSWASARSSPASVATEVCAPPRTSFSRWAWSELWTTDFLIADYERKITQHPADTATRRSPSSAAGVN